MIKLLISDFDGVFTDNSVYINEEGQESVRCNRSDGIGIKTLLSNNLKFIVCTSENVDCVSFRAKKIGFKAYLNVQNKGEFIKKYLEREKLNPVNVAYIGNDINDLSAFKVVGYKIAVRDAYPELISIADKVLEKNGGYGAVREACEHIIALNKSNF